METENHLRTSINGSMSQDLVNNYKRLNKMLRPPKPRKTKHFFVINKDKATKTTKAKSK